MFRGVLSLRRGARCTRNIFPRLFHASFFGVFTHRMLGVILGDSTARFSSFSGCAFQNSTARFSHPAGFQFVPQIPPPIHLQLPYVKPSQDHPPNLPRPPQPSGILPRGSFRDPWRDPPREPPGDPPGDRLGAPQGDPPGDPRGAQGRPEERPALADRPGWMFALLCALTCRGIASSPTSSRSEAV